MRIIVIGATGTIGHAVAQAFAARGDDVIRASRNGDTEVDITRPPAIHAMYQKARKVDAVLRW